MDLWEKTIWQTQQKKPNKTQEIHFSEAGSIYTQLYIVDDRKVDHLRETYKEQLFSLNKIKINLKILRYIEKYDFIKQIN